MIKKLDETRAVTFEDKECLYARDWSVSEYVLVKKINELIEEVNKLKEQE